MFGNGEWTYMTSPITSGAPSWPRSTPVENVHAGRRFLTLSLLIWLSVAIALVRIVARLHDPLVRVFLQLDQLIVRGAGARPERQSRGCEKAGAPIHIHRVSPG